MDFQKLTIKAQEAFASAQGDAIARGNPELTPEHLLAALVDQDGGVAPRMLEKAGESPAAAARAAGGAAVAAAPDGGRERAAGRQPRRCAPRWRRPSPRPRR